MNIKKLEEIISKGAIIKEGYKICTKCKHEKPSIKFNRRQESSDNKTMWCKACWKISNSNWRENKLAKGWYAMALRNKGLRKVYGKYGNVFDVVPIR